MNIIDNTPKNAVTISKTLNFVKRRNLYFTSPKSSSPSSLPISLLKGARDKEMKLLLLFFNLN